MRSELIDGRHLARRAVIYIRQSTPHQVLTNQESLRLQYDLRRRALDLGWREEDIEVIDSDLGLSGAAAAHRAGFKDLIARVTLGQVGIVLSSEVTRLSRNCTDWYPLQRAVRGPAPVTRLPGPEPGACGPDPRSPRPPPFAPPTPRTVARRCSPASPLLWRGLTSPVRASSATAPRLPDADQTARGPVVGREISRFPCPERACMPV